MRLGYKIVRGLLGQCALKLYDLEQPIPKPIGNGPAFVCVETVILHSINQGVDLAHRRGAIPVPEKE